MEIKEKELTISHTHNELKEDKIDSGVHDEHTQHQNSHDGIHGNKASIVSCWVLALIGFIFSAMVFSVICTFLASSYGKFIRFWININNHA